MPNKKKITKTLAPPLSKLYTKEDVAQAYDRGYYAGVSKGKHIYADDHEGNFQRGYEEGFKDGRDFLTLTDDEIPD